jgi:signal transduction histidine kinase
MAYEIALMIVAVVMIGGASLWGVNGLHEDYGSAIASYEELREVYEAGSHVATARTLLSLDQPDQRRAMSEIQAAATMMELAADGIASRKAKPREAVRAALVEAQGQLWNAMVGENKTDAEVVLASLNRGLLQVSNLATEMRRAIQKRQEAANQKRRMTLLVLSVLLAVVVGGAVGIGISQYRSVMNPLRRLGEGVRRIAEGRLSDRVEPTGNEEFVLLARDFNRMAEELDELYRKLEEKVAAKSRELVRSERLASVGYLAAGVAHEINNPIGIIAGHAELALQGMKSSDGPAEAERALRVISEEAFRCKAIVEKLLSLARPGEENRRVISLGNVASNVVSLIGGLGEYKDQKLILRIAEGQDLNVLASEGEMKQVLLNLAINALEAESKEVTIEARRNGGMVELAVTDDGKGMTAEVMERVFEPFFTAKRGAKQPGTGLGLSITHAIVESHGGRILAYSEGVGKGSRFVVELPGVGGERA